MGRRDRTAAGTNAPDSDDQRPVIVGDFNATNDHAQFRSLLTNGYQGAAAQSRAGYLPTYPTDRWYPPVIAIDHILTSRAASTNASTVAVPGSDDRGLLVRLGLDG